MPLAGFDSKCKPHAPRIVSTDKGSPCKHIGNNRKLALVTHYRIDGNVITSGKRCDFLLINENALTAYLIELKGRHSRDAIEQFRATETALKKQLQPYSLRYRLVSSKSTTHDINDSAFNKFKMQKKTAFVYRNGIIEEDI